MPKIVRCQLDSQGRVVRVIPNNRSTTSQAIITRPQENTTQQQEQQKGHGNQRRTAHNSTMNNNTDFVYDEEAAATQIATGIEDMAQLQVVTPRPRAADSLLLTIDAIPESGKITIEHCKYLLSGAQRNDDIILQNYLNKLTIMKKQVRAYAADYIKMKMIQEATEMKLVYDHYGKPKQVGNYPEIKTWLYGVNDNDDHVDMQLKQLCYGWAEFPNDEWDLELEKEFMSFHNWEYKAVTTRVNKDGIQEEVDITAKLSNNKVMKGCVARNMSNVKNQLVKDLNNVARKSDRGITISKKRSSEDVRDSNGKYIRKKKEPMNELFGKKTWMMQCR
jgi:hypothetical protein